MVLEYEGGRFLTDNDLEVKTIGRWPEIAVDNPELLGIFQEQYGRDFLGGDEIISFSQQLVSSGMSFSELQKKILETAEKEGKSIRDIVFNKTATGIGRGHSLGGLSGVVLGLHGTKMIDSGLTGLVSSRSLVTSGRRREVKEEDIVVPESIAKREYLLKEYLEITRAAFNESANFKEKFGKRGGIEAFNKALSYNNPADLILVLPLDTMATLAFEVKQDQLNSNGQFLPREIHKLVEMFPDIAEENGIGVMYKQRIQVPRDGYFHHNVFKDPSQPNRALEKGLELGMPINPKIIYSNLDLTEGFEKGLENLYKIFAEARKITDPEKLEEAALVCMLATRGLVGEYNEAAQISIADSLSFRVWSEQKRHATLRQNVESIYSAGSRTAKEMKKFFPQIETAYKNGNVDLPIEEIEKIIEIDNRLKKDPELLIPYLYHSGKQLMFFSKLVREGIPLRDASYVTPRNTRTRNLEHYDLINMIDLEFPLRLCSTCEPERYKTSWQKRGLIAKAFHPLRYLLHPKCIVGYCTEKDPCNHIDVLRGGYTPDLHKATKQIMLDKAR